MKPDKYYLVEWTCWPDAEAAAVKRGMPANGSLSDYVHLEDYERSYESSTFDEAVAIARRVLPDDAWNCPRIRRRVLVPNDHDDLGNRVRPLPSYETEATWEVFDGQPDPIEANPDWLSAA
jgi:hypothetical protein